MSTTATIIPRELIEGANNNSFFDRGSGLERDAQNESASFETCDELKRLEKIYGEFSDDQKAIVADRAASWRALVKEQYTAQASFQASNTPWFIAGPANYNSRRYNKRLDAAENKYKDFEEKKERFIKNTVDMLKKAATPEMQVKIWREGRQGYGETIAADDPLAVEKMEAHIANLKEIHEIELKANAWIRKNGKAAGCPVLSEKMQKEVDADLARFPYRVHKYFFTDQNQANIRNKCQRLEQLKKARAIVEEEKAEGLKLGTFEKEGLRMENNHEAARIQLFFDGKPDEETRARLKASGFRWSPRFGAWQRQNTPNGLAVARQFFNDYKAA
jgi:hypothetical protein